MTVFQKAFLILLIAILEFTLARFALLFKYWDLFSTLNFYQILQSFYYGLKFDLSSIIVFLSIPLLLITFPLSICRNKYWFGLNASLIYFLLVGMFFLLLGDIVYFSFVKRHLTNELIFLSNDFLYLLKIAWNDLLYFFSGILLVGVGFYFWNKVLFGPLRKTKYTVIKFIGFFLLLFVVGRGGFGAKPNLIVDAFSLGSSSQGNLILNGVFTASHYSTSTQIVDRLDIPQKEMISTLNLEEDFFSKQYPLSTSFDKNFSSKQYNIVFFLIEDLTHKYVDSFGNNNIGITPNLDELAKKGIKFTNFYSHGQRSVEGIQVVLTGLPSVIGIPEITTLASNYSKISNIAVKRGYSTYFVTSVEKAAFSTDMIVKSAGFKNYYGQEDMPVLQKYHGFNKMGWDYDAFMFALEKMNQSKGPTLTFIYPATDHTPFPRFPAPFNKFPHGKSNEGGYKNALNYTDWAIGEFFKKARKQKWFKDTIFIITADHTFAHFQSGEFLEKFRSPLIIYAPHIFKPEQKTITSSHLDLFPTLVYLMNSKEKFTSIGKNIFTKKENIALVRQGSRIGIITDKAFLLHSLKNRLEAESIHEKVPASYFDSLEKKLLSYDKITHSLINSNQWAE